MWRSDATRAAALVLLAALATGCVETAAFQAQQPFDYAAVPKPPLPEPSEGAIWQGDFPSGSFLFFDSKARGVGDLVTVLISERTRAENQATTALDSDSSVDIGLSSDVGLSALVSEPVRKALGLFLDDPGRDVDEGSELNVAASKNTQEFEGSGMTERRGTFEATITCRVVAELPGDVFHVRGRRSVVVNHELQYLTLEGLVRREDIGIDNTVRSTSLAEAKITIDGIGVVDDKQRPGWLTRVFSWIYPL